MDARAEIQDIKRLLLSGDSSFWLRLDDSTMAASTFEQLLFCSSLRRKAIARGLVRPGKLPDPINLGLVGGYSLYPLSELLEHYLDTLGVPANLFSGDYDNYTAEVTDENSPLHAFGPSVLCMLPSPRLATPSGSVLDARDVLETEAQSLVEHLLGLCAAAHDHSQCEVVLANFPLPGRHDIGPFRGRTMGSDWSFRKYVNLELGLGAPAYLHICDLEFLTNRRGAINTEDERAWFESKQPGSPHLLVDLARELANIVVGLRRPPKKVLVLDLDNTLWGGVIGDDGLEGIEIGDTSPRGEAYKAFQRYVKSLKERGVLLAVCSKNDHDKAIEPFEKHPEMVLRMSDFSAFVANWDPKADNIRRMAVDLNLGLDSFVFVDDNAAEVEIVRQFAPEVMSIHLGPDPAQYGTILRDCRQFEPLNVTADDAKRTEQYHSEQERKGLLASAVDMDAYLESLEMKALVNDFNSLDVPRLAQLINKSNQFNLTTRRRTEAEVTALIDDPEHTCFSVRLADRFGDHGLIAIAIAHIDGDRMTIDTWLMSCRVLKRQVEEEVLNELVRRATVNGCAEIVGVYL
ncbi:MAG: HAD-IIIC family phosphatase, partial [Gammaproteobacteria bacterium]|nr:HAD-IIIC family phosphatase [Gammaproteobacteria bacterium]